MPSLKTAALLCLLSAPLAAQAPPPMAALADQEQNAQPPTPRKSFSPLRSAAGLYPVYEMDGGWMLIERDSRGGALTRGARLLVVGSDGVAEFFAARSTHTWAAACARRRPVKTRAWRLSSRAKGALKAVGVPVVAIRLKPAAAFDVSKALFYPLKNEVRETLYKKLDFPIRKAAVEDLRSGAFAIPQADAAGRALAAEADPLRLQMKIDFSSKIRVKGLKDAVILVEGTQVSETYRRCMRLFEGPSQKGEGSSMPHELMTETRTLDFVAYDPNRSGSPFVLAFTRKQPLWGHERWGWRITAEGAKPFLQDALDARCRENF
ncbi:MAG: hypothetical protein WCU88_05610 [Elusimicrobiota bacterium]